MSSRGGASSSRVSIPHNVRKMIQDIQEVTGKQHSEEDVHAVLKECSMDPNETIDRLLYLDTFHEVKSKRDRRKEVQNVNSRAPEEPRRKLGLQGRGSRGGRGNFPSSYSSHEAGGGRSATFRKENGVDGNKERVIIPSNMSPAKEAVSKVRPIPMKLTMLAINGTMKVPIGSPQAGEVMQLPAVGSTDLHQGDKDTFKTVGKGLSPQPEGLFQHAPSASDPVLVPSQDSWPTSPIGAIKREVWNQRVATESNVILDDRLMDASAKFVAHNQVSQHGSQDVHEFEISSSVSKGPAEPKTILQPMMVGEIIAHEKQLPSETPQFSVSPYPVPEHSSNLNSSGIQVAVLSRGSETDLVQKPSNVLPSETFAFEAAPVQVNANSKSVASKTTLSEETTLKLEKLKFSDGDHVIIPNHIQVPENVKSILSFGSFDASFIDGINVLKDSDTGKESTNPAELSKDETFKVPSLSNQDSSLIAEDGKFSDQPQAPLMIEEAPMPKSESQVAYEVGLNVSAVEDDQLKHELPATGPPYPVIQNTPSYGFGFLPQMLGSQLPQVDGLESQALASNSVNGNSLTMAASASTPPPIQSPGTGQGSISLPPPLPLFRQPIPHGYFPYSHYYPPFYLPQAVHQYFGHGGFSPQLPTGSMYLQQPGAASGMKVDPASYKPGTNSGSATHVVMPSGYGVYSSSQLGYGPSAAVTSGISNGSDEHVGSALKETNVYPGQQSEGPSVWIPATGREAPSFPFNSFLNLPPQGQHATMAPQSAHAAFATVYPPLQTIPNAAAGHPLLQQSHSQPVAGALESTGTLPQRQQINWNGGF